MKYHFGSHSNPSELWQQTIREPPPLIAVDTETIGLKDRTLLGVGISLNQSDSFYITENDPDFYQMIQLLTRSDIIKVYHNALFDLRVLRKYRVDYTNVCDTAIAARLAGLSGTLEDAGYLLGMEIESARSVLFRYEVKSMDKLPPDVIARKCCVDTEATLALYHYLKDTIDSDYFKIEMRVQTWAEKTSQIGIKVDQERRAELEAYYSKGFSFYKTVAEGMGFNPGSKFETGYMLASAGAFLPMTRKKTMLATDEKTLQKVTAAKAIPIAQLVLLYRQAEKQLSTFIRPYAGVERAYTMLHLDAATGRISGTSAGKHEPDRNLLNITKRADRAQPPHLRIRSQFLPDKDVFTLADDSQAEMRILAYLSQDPVMMEVYSRADGDIHLDTEQAIWGTSGYNRLVAKIFNYAMLYGGDAYTVADGIGTSDVAGVAHRIQLWSQRYARAWEWREEMKTLVWQQGYVETLYGRRMEIPIEQGQKHAENCAINYPIQGTAADIFKRTLLACSDLPIILPVHDERIFNGRTALPSGLEDISPIRIPIEVKYAARWE